MLELDRNPWSPDSAWSDVTDACSLTLTRLTSPASLSRPLYHRRADTAQLRELWKKRSRPNSQASSGSSRLRPAPTPKRRPPPDAYLSTYCRHFGPKAPDDELSDPRAPSGGVPVSPEHIRALQEQVRKSPSHSERPYVIPLHLPGDVKGRPQLVASLQHGGILFSQAYVSPALRGPHKGRRHVIHPEWASEHVSWQRLTHPQASDVGRYSWM